MKATFDFETAMALALGGDWHPTSRLAWAKVAGGLLLAAPEDLLPDPAAAPGGRLN